MPNRYARPVLRWYSGHARDLPWRRPGVSAWSVLVSEVMLQQTPVDRVRPAHRAWLDRWPTPAGLAAATPADAIRQWGRLGYPRRAVRLHAAARLITERFAGEVPRSVPDLLSLPGVGGYTAAAVACFAFGERHAVLDTNVRRVLARLVRGNDQARGGVSVAESRLADALLPADRGSAARWSVAVMELGALVCTHASPSCGDCPVAGQCTWRLAGSPATATRRPAQPRYAGSDRECRGRLLAVLRQATGPVPAVLLNSAWPDHEQRDRALASLIADGLAVAAGDGRIALPAAR